MQLYIHRSLNRPQASTHEVADLAEASKLYGQVRDEADEGASTFPNGIVKEDGKQVAHISYNGRVWAKDGKFIMEAQS